MLFVTLLHCYSPNVSLKMLAVEGHLMDAVLAQQWSHKFTENLRGKCNLVFRFGSNREGAEDEIEVTLKSNSHRKSYKFSKLISNLISFLKLFIVSQLQGDRVG